MMEESEENQSTLQINRQNCVNCKFMGECTFGYAKFILPVKVLVRSRPNSNFEQIKMFGLTS
jgi:hypothetical protein